MRPTLIACVLLLIACTARVARAEIASLGERIDALVNHAAGLSADQVASRAVSTSYSLQARQQEVQAAVAQVNQAVVNFIPRITPSVRYTRLSDFTNPSLGNIVFARDPGPIPDIHLERAIPLSFPTYVNQTLIQLNITVPLLDYVMRIPFAYAAARDNERAAALNARAAELQTAADARVLYYTWARARLQVAIAEQALDQARQHATTVRHLQEAGAASRADLMRIEAQVASSELFVASTHDAEAVLEDQVRTAMHDPERTPYEIAEDLRVALERVALPEAPQLIADAWSKRLEIKSLLASVEAVRAQKRVAQSGILPRLDAYADLVHANPNPRYLPPNTDFKTTWDVGVQLSWTLNEIPNGVFAGDGAEAKAAQVLAQCNALQDQLRSEVMQASEGLREADLSVESTQRGLGAAQESYRVRTDLFANGRATSVELTDSQTDLTRARLDAVGAHINQRIARVRLAHATGQDIP